MVEIWIKIRKVVILNFGDFTYRKTQVLGEFQLLIRYNQKDFNASLCADHQTASFHGDSIERLLRENLTCQVPHRLYHHGDGKMPPCVSNHASR